MPDVEAVDIEKEGYAARWDPLFAPIGANANFVSVDPDGTLRVRTFEKGVEAETLACGTGITASAIAAYLTTDASHRAGGPSFAGQEKIARQILGRPSSTTPTHASVGYSIQARIARLAVDFRPGQNCFTDVYLTGPADEIR